MTYFYISLSLFALYLACKTSYKKGKDEGVQIGFSSGKAYGRALEKNTIQRPDYHTNRTDEWRFTKAKLN